MANPKTNEIYLAVHECLNVLKHTTSCLGTGRLRILTWFATLSILREQEILRKFVFGNGKIGLQLYLSCESTKYVILKSHKFAMDLNMRVYQICNPKKS